MHSPFHVPLQVQQIQKEYQDFMEKVRAKAQTAIDTANRDYQNAKAVLTQRMNLYIEYLQSQVRGPRPRRSVCNVVTLQPSALLKLNVVGLVVG